MKKTIFAVNGSPRENGNTALILKSYLEGAASAGAETRIIHLGRYTFSGCRSCFGCKLKGGASYGKCAINDALTPILAELSSADGIVMGSPVYFGAESGIYRCFLERLFFPYLKYSAPASSLAPRKIEMDFVSTMNVPPEIMEQNSYRTNLEKVLNFASLVFRSSSPQMLYVHDTLQFDDYSKYESAMFDAQHKLLMRETRFKDDLARAFEMGKKMALNA